MLRKTDEKISSKLLDRWVNVDERMDGQMENWIDAWTDGLLDG